MAADTSKSEIRNAAMKGDAAPEIWVIEEKCNFGWVAIDFRQTRKEARKIKAALSRARASAAGTTLLINEFRVEKYYRNKEGA